jgi:hypothetical protein
MTDKSSNALQLTAKLLLTLASIVILGSESHETNYHILLSDGSGSLQSAIVSLTATANWSCVYQVNTDRIENISSIIALVSCCRGSRYLAVAVLLLL